MAAIAIAPTHDAYVNYNMPTTVQPYTNPWWPRLHIGVDTYGTGADAHGLCIAIMKFNLSSIPAGSTINSATLLQTCFYVGGDYGNVDISAYDCGDTSWSPLTITWASLPVYGPGVIGTYSLDPYAPQDFAMSISTSYVQSKIGGYMSMVFTCDTPPNSFSMAPAVTMADTDQNSPLLDPHYPILTIVYTPPASTRRVIVTKFGD